MTPKDLVHRISLPSRSTPSKMPRHESPGSESPPAGDDLPTKEVRCSHCPDVVTRLESSAPGLPDSENTSQFPDSESSGIDRIGPDFTGDAIPCYDDIDDQMLRWVKDLVVDIMNPDKPVLNQSNAKANPPETILREALRKLNCELYKSSHDVCLDKSGLKHIQQTYTGPFALFRLNLPALWYTSDELFKEPADHDKYPFKFICRPCPDLTFGYTLDSFPDTLTSLRPNECT
ncbi:hypothetical protein F5B19DRAFT_465117 [Rostrohypoxylon terebratum]|nr:hypothetical protein F5B19DRAFT_465117 [Rostrohypoxylon terebratum]